MALYKQIRETKWKKFYGCSLRPNFRLPDRTGRLESAVPYVRREFPQEDVRVSPQSLVKTRVRASRPVPD
eukprot:589371-Rhodomonas_salina.2